MLKTLPIYIFFFNVIFAQTENHNMVAQENSVFWKKGIDKIILKDGELFYGQFIKIEKSGEVLFQIEFEDVVTTFKSSNIRHLVLANGHTIIRNNRNHRPVCYCLSLFTMLYVYSLNIK